MRVPAVVGLMLLALVCFAGARAGRVSAAGGALHGPPAAGEYAGDAACARCHAGIAASYGQTAHHFTSRLARPGAVLGSFAPGQNVMATGNPRLVFEMKAADGALTETAKYFTAAGDVQRMTEPMDVVVGSGRKGQTYLWWGGDQLFELPVSYWTGNGAWINSPGYEDGTAHFDRPILPRCLECHASFFTQPQAVFTQAQAPGNRYERASLVLGIGCERCHGPGAEHVRREQGAAKGAGAAESIVNPARLSRERQIDGCALCHAGPGRALGAALSFQVGDVLAEYVETQPAAPGAPLDVHTNQVGLLRESKCFRASGMTCTTCHDVHTVQRDAESFAPKCLSCHRVQQCGEFKVMHAAIRTKCVSCHMPLEQSKTLFAESAGGRLAPEIRSHLIAIYDEGKARVSGSSAR